MRSPPKQDECFTDCCEHRGGGVYLTSWSAAGSLLNTWTGDRAVDWEAAAGCMGAEVAASNCSTDGEAAQEGFAGTGRGFAAAVAAAMPLDSTAEHADKCRESLLAGFDSCLLLLQATEEATTATSAALLGAVWYTSGLSLADMKGCCSIVGNSPDVLLWACLASGVSAPLRRLVE